MSPVRPAAYAAKALFEEPRTAELRLTAQKTMYDGKRIRAGDRVYLFSGGPRGSLVARGVVVTAVLLDRHPDHGRQVPRVDVVLRLTECVEHALGRAEVAAFRRWDDGRPETEINFKFYRQTTDKIIGLSPATARFLASRFAPDGG